MTDNRIDVELSIAQARQLSRTGVVALELGHSVLISDPYVLVSITNDGEDDDPPALPEG